MIANGITLTLSVDDAQTLNASLKDVTRAAHREGRQLPSSIYELHNVLDDAVRQHDRRERALDYLGRMAEA